MRSALGTCASEASARFLVCIYIYIQDLHKLVMSPQFAGDVPQRPGVRTQRESKTKTDLHKLAALRLLQTWTV